MTIKYSTITISNQLKALNISDEDLAEATKAMGEIFQKRFESEIIGALGVPPELIQPTQPTIRVEIDRLYEGMKAQLDEKRAIFDSMLRYNFAYGYYSARPKPSKPVRITKRRDGREQKTCTCDAAPYPHRAGSVEGCE